MVIPNIVRIGHCVLTVTDLAASKRFYVDLLGLNILHQTSTALYLRGVEDREWSLKLEQADQAGVREMAYKVGSEADLDALTKLAEREGLPFRFSEDKDRPRLLRMQDPFGFPVAFYFASAKYPWLLQRFDLHRGPAPQRIDHFNLYCPRVNDVTRWYMDRLGFRLSEFSEDEQGRIWASWIQRKGNVHDLAFTNGTGPRLHHLAYWMPESARIFQCCDTLAGALMDAHIERGPGRHGISNAFYLYLRDPDGHRIELYTSDYLTVDPDFEPIRWDIHDPRRQQLWGGIAPKSWFLEGSRVEAFEGGWQEQSETDLKGLPAYIR